jgi:hypothetical protein
MIHSHGDAGHVAFFDFREETRGLDALSPEAQIGVLKHKLFVALERAVDFQHRSRELETTVERLEAEQRARAREHQAFAARSVRELAEARRLCHGLLRTIELAAAPDPAEASEPDASSQSASA